MKSTRLFVVALAITALFTGCLLVEDGPVVPADPTLAGTVERTRMGFTYEKDKGEDTKIKTGHAKIRGGTVYILSWNEFREDPRLADAISSPAVDDMLNFDYDLDEAFVVVMNLAAKHKSLEEPVVMTYLLIVASIQEDENTAKGKEWLKLRGIGGQLNDVEYGQIHGWCGPKTIEAASVVAPWVLLNGKGHIIYKNGYPVKLGFSGNLKGAMPGEFFFNAPITFKATTPGDHEVEAAKKLADDLDVDYIQIKVE